MTDFLEQLERLTNLYERGALSREEFEAEKARLRNAPGTAITVQGSSVPEPQPEPAGANPRRWMIASGGVGIIVLGLAAGLIATRELSSAAGRAPPADAEQAAAGATSPEMDGVISFADAASCEPSQGFAALLDEIAQAAADGSGGMGGLVRVAGIEEPFAARSAMQQRGSAQVRLAAIDVEGEWQGLKLRQVRTVRWSDGLADGFRLQFANPPHEVAAVLKQVGIGVGKLGSLHQQDGRLVGFEQQEGGTALLCIAHAQGEESAEGGTDQESTAG